MSVSANKMESKGGKLSFFRGFTPEPGADIMSPGLVADGTRCGNGFVRLSLSLSHNYSNIQLKLCAMYYAMLTFGLAH